MARTLPPAAVGTVILALGVASTVAGVATLGLGTAAGRRVAARRASADVEGARASGASALALAFLGGSAAALLTALSAPLLERFFGVHDLGAVVPPLALFVLAFPLGAAAVGVGRAWGDAVGRAALREALGGVLRVMGVAVGILLWRDPRGAAAGYAVGAFLGEISYVVLVCSRGWVGRAGLFHRDAVLMRDLPPYWAMTTMAQMEAWLDTILLGAVAPASVLALYGLARGLMRAVRLAEYAASHAFLPTATGLLLGGDANAFHRLFVRTKVLVFALQWPPLVLCFTAPELVMRTLFGSDYGAGAGALQLFAVAVAFNAVGSVGKDQTLLAAGRSSLAMVADTTALIVTAPLLLWFGASHGAIGAAGAVLAGTLVRALILTWLVVVRFALVPRAHDLHPLPLLLVALAGAWHVVAAVSGLSPAIRAATAVAAASLGAVLCGVALWLDHRRPGAFFPAGTSPAGSR